MLKADGHQHRRYISQWQRWKIATLLFVLKYFQRCTNRELGLQSPWVGQRHHFSLFRSNAKFFGRSQQPKWKIYIFCIC